MKAVLKRFLEIWKPDFLQKLAKEESQQTTWFFWFFYNSIAALVFSIVLVFMMGQLLNKGLTYLAINYPDAKVTLENGRLSTEGFNEPIFWAEKKSAFIMDTKGEKYEPSMLDKYSAGYFIGGTKIYNKKADSSVETSVYDLSKIEKNFSITRQALNDKIENNLIKIYLITLLSFFVFSLIFLAGFKLISALWWALIFWVLALILGIKEFKFKKIYEGVLNFYFIVLIFQGIGVFTNMHIPFLTTLIFLLLFSLNFRHLKKNTEPIAPQLQESKIKEEQEVKNEKIENNNLK